MFSFSPNLEKLREKGDVEALMKLLDHKKLEIRKQVAELFRDWGKPECAPGLLKALKDEHREVRIYAVQGLARLRDLQTDHAIESATKDSDWEVRKEALSALVKSGRNLETTLEAIRFNSAELRELAASRLGDSRDTRAVHALILAVDDEEELVRLRAVNALGKIKDPDSRSALERATKDKDPQVSKAAQAALEDLTS